MYYIHTYSSQDKTVLILGLTVSPQFHDYLEDYECHLIWKLGLGRYNQIIMRSYQIRVGPNSDL